MGDDKLELTPEERLAEHGLPGYADMERKTYKERVGEIANAYWQTRKVFCSDEATAEEREAARVEGKRLWEAMAHVPADPLPAWVRPELATLADKLALKERSLRDDLPGAPVICRGSWPFDDSGYGLLDRFEGWREIEGLDTHNFLATHDELLAVFTVCEGDLTLDIFKTAIDHAAYRRYCERFYGRSKW